MEKFEFFMMFFIIMAALALILRCALRPFRKKKEIYGIPVEVIKNLKDVWQDNPEILSNLPRVIEQWNEYEDEINRKQQERDTRMGQYAMLEKNGRKPVMYLPLATRHSKNSNFGRCLWPNIPWSARC